MNGNVQEFKKRGWYFFVHDEDLRESYDTYFVIESLAESGFQDKSTEENNVTNNIIVMNKKK